MRASSSLCARVAACSRLSCVEEIELAALLGVGDALRRVQIRDRLAAGRDARALIDRRHEAAAPVARAIDHRWPHYPASRRRRAGSDSRCRGRSSTHAPSEGRPPRIEPVFIWQTPEEWLMPSAQHERMTARSSAHSAMCGSQSLTQIPLWPCCFQARFEAEQRRARFAHRGDDLPKLAGSGLPASSLSFGLGSKVSRWTRPAFHEEEDHAFGAGRKLRAGAAAAAAWPSALPLHRRREHAALEQMRERERAEARAGCGRGNRGARQS